MFTRSLAALALVMVPCLSPAQTKPDEFVRTIRPVLAQNCTPCHNPADPKNRINFLKATTAKDLEADRGLWQDVATQLRNRTMPAGDSKLTEDDRLRVARYIDNRLRLTACSAGEFAGAVALRRLNRREYRNTIRDLLGIDFNVSEIFPTDGTGGSGFDTNGETLYVPPLLTERYLEAAQQILDRAIITPDLLRVHTLGTGKDDTSKSLPFCNLSMSIPTTTFGSASPPRKSPASCPCRWMKPPPCRSSIPRPVAGFQAFSPRTTSASASPAVSARSR